MNGCPCFRVTFKEDKMRVDFQQVQTITEVDNPYKGEYSIRPKMDEQILPTRGRVLFEDVVVQAIPIIRTSNPSVGTTVYIANEV